MNSLISNAASMTSLEIAELTGKRHANVLSDIRNMLSQVYDLQDNSNLSYQSIQGVAVDYCPQTKRVSCYHLDKDHTLTLVTGYSAKLRHRVIVRWQELEQGITSTATAPIPAGESVRIINDGLTIASLFGVPTHYAQIEAVKTARQHTGLDYSGLLQYSPAQENIPDDEVMLEPTDLADRLNLGSGRDANNLLCELGLQVKQGSAWIPTPKGESISQLHSWCRKSKSGYNLKWNVSAVKNLIQPN